MPPWPVLRLQDNNIECTKNLMHFPICACHPCAGAMLIFPVSFQFDRMFPEGNPHRLAENEVTILLGILQSYPRQSVQILVFDPRFFQTQLGIECFPPCPLPSLLLEAFFALSCRWRPYRVESTRSLPTSEVKQPRAWLVLSWGTAWEDQGAASFCPFSFSWPTAPHCPLSNCIDRTWHAYLCHFQSAFCPTLPTPPMPDASKWGQILFSKALLLVLLQGMARRESNPGHKHGRLVCCRYTTGAMTQAKKQGSGCWRLPHCPPSFPLPNNTALQPNI